MRIGYFLSSEEYTPAQLVEQARMAEDAGFESLWISDHFHPWNDAQGQSAFVWSVIGALSQVCSLPVTTAVTCPTVRVHPAIVAHAAATSANMLDSRFTLGLGSGEALNEHVHGDRWPSATVRLQMLEEAVDVIRKMWTGRSINHHGRHYTVEDARIYTLPSRPPEIHISGFGPKAAALAGRIGDGYITISPDPEPVEIFRDQGGAGKPIQAGYKVCWGVDDELCVRTAHELWSNSGVPGELAQVLPSPKHFEQASQLVTLDQTRSSIAYGQDVDRHVEAFRPFAKTGFDVVHISQMGGAREGTEAKGFFDFYRDQVLPELRKL